MASSGALMSSPTMGVADQVRLAHALLEARGDLFEQRIAGGMAERIVHILEAVEVEPEHRHQLAVPFRAGHGAVEMLMEL
jgi:hypothetical protein